MLLSRPKSIYSRLCDYYYYYYIYYINGIEVEVFPKQETDEVEKGAEVDLSIFIIIYILRAKWMKCF